MTATEYVILVNAEDQEIGLAEKLSAHQQHLLHRAFSVFIFRDTPQPELLLQQRAFNKYHSPGLWTNTCCSHPRVQEDIVIAGQRRLQEELLIHTPLKQLGWFHYHAHFPNGLAENEIDHVLVGRIPATTPVTPNPEEVQAYRWITLPHLTNEMATHPQQFTPWLVPALKLLLDQWPFDTAVSIRDIDSSHPSF
jgi:isopentenyl-diphosphate delta-isomerase type 1